ncbi:hypothetical protein E2C01_090546 [Portunus trituberculatus]|uniref:Secreted protein n=1 Tax=Portunus trituberculatus TaxID=210409 RepID=A0A5B7JKG3_PORTR|nr:hypothetical protein [Portunus trituberculatus]
MFVIKLLLFVSATMRAESCCYRHESKHGNTSLLTLLTPMCGEVWVGVVMISPFLSLPSFALTPSFAPSRDQVRDIMALKVTP